MNATLETLFNRASLRQYDKRPISDEHIDLIIESAMRAPTAGNMMLYSILHVQDQATKDKLSETCDHQPFIAKAPLVLIFLADMQRWFDYYQHCGVEEFCKQQGLTYEGPDEADLLLACNDAIIAAQNAVIGAESLGIGSCYIGDIMENYETHREMFNLPDWVFPISMLCFGYYPEGVSRQVKTRFKREYIVFDEQYQRLSGAQLEDMFAERSTIVTPNNKFGASNFGQFMYARKTGAAFAREMSRSVEVALKYWQSK